MATVHLMCGFLGAGKTTTAKKLAVQYNAVRLSNDDIMRAFYGRTPEEFDKRYQIADAFVWDLAEQIVSAGASVILDYGFWTKLSRQKAVERAKVFCQNVRFHCVECDFETARKRALNRTATDDAALYIDESFFDAMKSRFEPLTPEEGFDVVYYRNI